MVNSNDGFEIAEVDLKLRGPGDLSGTQQSGVLNLKIADLIKDGQLLFLARNIAIEVLKEDPDLALPKNKPLLSGGLCMGLRFFLLGLYVYCQQTHRHLQLAFYPWVW